MKRRFVSYLLFLLLLIGSLTLICPVSSDISVHSGVPMITRSNNAIFTVASTTTFYKIGVNSTHLRIDIKYTDKYAEYWIEVSSPNNVSFRIDYWFPTLGGTNDTSASLTILQPYSADITFTVYSLNFVSMTVTGAKTWSYNGVTKTVSVVGNTFNSLTIIFNAIISPSVLSNHPPYNVATWVSDAEVIDGQNWVFADERTYHFIAEFYDPDGYSDLSWMGLSFYDGVNSSIQFEYDRANLFWAVVTQRDKATLERVTEEIIDIHTLRITFPIYPSSKISDKNNVDLWMKCEDFIGAIDDWEVKNALAFNLYNLGGLVSTQQVGNASRLEAGDIWDFWSNETHGWIRSDLTYRNFQHLQTMFRWSPYGDANDVETRFGVDGYFDNSWQTLFTVRIRTQSWEFGHDLITKANYVKFTVEWYQGGLSDGESGTLIKNETLYAAWQDPKISEGHIKLWFDIWFNRLNGSTTMGARIAPYLLGYQYTIGLDLAWHWGVDLLGLSQQSLSYIDLNSGGTLLSCSEIQLMHVWSSFNYTHTSAGDYDPRQTDFSVFKIEIAKGKMVGIDTPSLANPIQLEPSSDPNVGTYTDIFRPIVDALGMVTNPIVSGLNWVAQQVLAGITTIFSWLQPYIVGAWSSFITWLSSLPYIGQFITWLGNAYTTIVAIFGTIFTYFGLLVSGITGFFNGIVIVWNQEVTIWNLLTVTYGQFTLFAIGIAFIELVREGAEGDWQPLLNVLTIIWGIVSFLLNWSMRILEFIMDRILGGLPI